MLLILIQVVESVYYSVRDEQYTPDYRPIVVFDGLPKEQDDHHSEYRPTVVFNRLSNVQDGTYPPDYRPIVVFDGLPKEQDDPYSEYRPTVVFNRLSNVQDGTFPPEYRPIVVFSPKNIDAAYAGTPVRVRSLLPLLHILVHFLSNVYTIFEHAYVSPANWHPSRAAIIVCIEAIRFFEHSHDFAAFQQRMGEKLLRVLYSVLYNFSWTRFLYL